MNKDQNLNCVFCKIISGEIPSKKVFEDEHFVAFLDIKPQTAGHVQIIPKKHFRWVWDLPINGKDQPTIGRYFEVAKIIAEAQRKVFNTDWIISKVIGDEVHHAHIWVFPAKDFGDKNNFTLQAQKIKDNLTSELK